MPEALVFGGSGQIGAALLPRLLDTGWRVHAVSRQARVDATHLRWLQGDLEHVDGLPARVDAIFSCGPLDHFARWYARTEVVSPRVIAFGSTSGAVKRDSADAHERDLAMRLRAAEQAVFEAAVARAAAATLLRPTLVYGAARDRTLSRVVQFARRWHGFVLPRDAMGLRQPVHVDDLAAAAFACLDRAASFGRGYDLPGGETLTYREMLARVLACLQPPLPLRWVPAPVFAMLAGGLRLLGRGDGFGAAAAARLREDLVFDAGPAMRDFGYAPRVFAPQAAMFAPD